VHAYTYVLRFCINSLLYLTLQSLCICCGNADLGFLVSTHLVRRRRKAVVTLQCHCYTLPVSLSTSSHRYLYCRRGTGRKGKILPCSCVLELDLRYSKTRTVREDSVDALHWPNFGFQISSQQEEYTLSSGREKANLVFKIYLIQERKLLIQQRQEPLPFTITHTKSVHCVLACERH
jgi:hypothetical protein